MPISQTGTYAAFAVSVQLERTIGPTRFDATKDRHEQQLNQRTDLPPDLKRLLLNLFRRGVIIGCTITYGQRLVLRLPQQDPQGRIVMGYQALQRLQEAITTLTGRRISITSSTAGPGPTARRPSDTGGHGRRSEPSWLDGVGDLIDGIGSLFD